MLHLDAVPQQVAVLMEQLSDHPALRSFALGGGTSLALRFGHRISVDLDYFTTLEFHSQQLFEELGLVSATVLSLAKNTLCLDVGGVKIDLLRHAYTQLAPIDQINGQRLLSLSDLAAMKLNAVANRGSKKDFYDLVELLKHHTLREMLGFFSVKYPNTDPFVAVRSLAWFEDAEQEPDPISRVDQTWIEVKKILSAQVSML